MGCAIFFNKDNMVYQLPVNPEEVETNSVQAIEKYEVLKLGQIAIPTHMKLTEYSFNAELPHQPLHYVETSAKFMEPSFYLSLFREWRDSNEPVRFISTDGIGEDIDALVLIDEIRETDKAGEEGDKYISLKLLEYREFSKKTAFIVEDNILPFSIKPVVDEVNPNSSGYHVVVSGDTLWAIAKKYYGDGSKCNIIFNANKDKIKNPAVIQVGWKLKIPDKSEFSKYSAPLPKTVTEKPKYQGGVSDAGRTHSSGGRPLDEYSGGTTDLGRTHSSSSKKIVIYKSGYNLQGLRGGTNESGRTYSSGGRKL